MRIDTSRRAPRRKAPRWSLAATLIAAFTAGEATGAPGSGSARAYYLYSLAQQAQFQSDYNEAIRLLQEAIHSADSTTLRVELASIYSTLGRAEEAESEIRAAVKMNPEDVEARKALARLLGARAGEDPADARRQEAETIYKKLIEEGKDDEATVLALADLELSRNDAAAATAELERYRASHPSSIPVDLLTARIYQQIGRGEAALPLLRGILQRAPDHRETREVLADALEDAGQMDEAIAVLRSLAEGAPNRPYPRFRLGVALLSEGRFDEAVQVLQGAVQLDPGNARLLLALGRGYLGQNQEALAEETFLNALDHDAGSLEARFFLARIYQGRADDSRALDLYSQVLAGTSTGAAPSDKMFFGLASFQVGLIRYLQRDYPAAIRSLEQALEVTERPGDELYALLGRVFLSAERSDEARRIVDQGREKFPDSVPLAGLSAELAFQGGDAARGDREIAGLLKSADGSEEGYLEVIQIQGRLGKFREASRRCSEALARHPDSISLRFQDAALEERRGRFAESEKKFRSLLALKPDYAEALNYLGYMLADRGVKLDEARMMVEKALSIEPSNAAFLDSLGWVHFRLKEYPRAEELLRRAAPASRDDATILEHLGDVLDATGRRAEALESYRQARERGPENVMVLDKKIRRLERHAGGK